MTRTLAVGDPVQDVARNSRPEAIVLEVTDQHPDEYLGMDVTERVDHALRPVVDELGDRSRSSGAHAC